MKGPESKIKNKAVLCLLAVSGVELPVHTFLLTLLRDADHVTIEYNLYRKQALSMPHAPLIMPYATIY